MRSNTNERLLTFAPCAFQKHEPQPAKELTLHEPFETFCANRAKVGRSKPEKLQNHREKRKSPPPSWATFALLERDCEMAQKSPRRKSRNRSHLRKLHHRLSAHPRCKSLAPFKFSGYVTMANQFRF
jgi:hypothetical protein